MKSLSKKLRPPLITAAALFAAVLSVAGSAWATPEWEDATTSFGGKHVTISFTSWFGGYSETDYLYYNALVKNLDAFVGSLKKKGKLDDEKIYFYSIMGSWYSHVPDFSLEGYTCSFQDSKYITQNNLAKVITYLTTADTDSGVSWNSDYDTAALQNFNAIIDTIKVPYKFAPRKVMDVGNGFAVYFQGGSLVCKDADSIYYDIDKIPFTIGSKTFISAKKTVYIVDNGKVTLKTAGEIRKPEGGKYSDFFIIAAAKTVYVVENGEITKQIEEKFSDVTAASSNGSSVYAIATAKALYIFENGKAPYQFNEKLNEISKPLVAGSKIFITGHIKDYAIFYAIEDGKILDRVKFKEECEISNDGSYETCDYEYIKTEVFPKWVNYRTNHGYKDYYFLSYSIEKNKFYKVDKKVEEE